MLKQVIGIVESIREILTEREILTSGLYRLILGRPDDTSG